MTIERLAPDAILELSGASPSTLSFIQDDPDAPDGNWIQANSSTSNPIIRTSFATPHASPTIGAGLQEFRVLVRKSSGAGLTPTARIDIYESGTLKATGATQDVTSASGQVLSETFNENLFTDPAGSNVECRVVCTHANFLITNVSVDIGAVEWNATEAAIPYAGSSGSSGAGAGAATFSADYSGSNGSDGASVSAAAVPTTARGSSGSSGAFVAESIPVADYVGSSGSSGAAEDTSTTLIGGVGSSGSSGIFMSQSLQGLVALGSSGSSGAYTADVEQFAANVGSSGSSGSYAPTVDFCLGDIERLPPDAILEQTNLVGDLDAIQDDPDAPDGSWWTAPLPLLPTSARTSFPTPSFELGCGAPEEECFADEVVAFDNFNRLDTVCVPYTSTLGVADSGQAWLPYPGQGGLYIDSGVVGGCVTPGVGGFPCNYVLTGAAARSVSANAFVSPGVDVLSGRPLVGMTLLCAEGSDAVDTIDCSVALFGGGRDGTQGSVITFSLYRQFGFGPGSFTIIEVPTTLSGGETHRLRADVDETGWRCYLDDLLVISAPHDDPSHFARIAAADGCGLQFNFQVDPTFWEDGQSRWSNFVVTQPVPVACPGTPQEFRGLVRSTALGVPPPLGLLAPTARLELWESGVLLASSPEFAVNSSTGEVISWSWSPSLLTDPTGAGVEARIVGTPAILGEVGWTVELGALEWNAASCAGCRYHGSGGSDGSYTPSVGMSADYAGSSGSGGATQTFIVTGSAYAGSSGSSGSSDTRTLRFADYLGSSGSSGHQTAPACGVVDGESPLLPVCTVSGPI